MNTVCWFGVMNFLMVCKWNFPQNRPHFQQLNSRLHFGKAQNPRSRCLLSWLPKWLWVDLRGDCCIKGRTLWKRNRCLLRAERTWVLACHIDPGQVQSSTRPMHDYSKCPMGVEPAAESPDCTKLSVCSFCNYLHVWGQEGQLRWKVSVTTLLTIPVE